MRGIDRVLGRDGGNTGPTPPRPFGTSAEEAAAVAAAAGSVPRASVVPNADGSPAPGISGRVNGTTGGAGSSPNMTSSTYSSNSSRGETP